VGAKTLAEQFVLMARAETLEKLGEYRTAEDLAERLVRSQEACYRKSPPLRARLGNPQRFLFRAAEFSPSKHGSPTVLESSPTRVTGTGCDLPHSQHAQG
jgi:hypothetical protein